MLEAQSHISIFDENPFEIKQSRFWHSLISISCLCIAAISFYSVTSDSGNDLSAFSWIIGLILLSAGVYSINSIYNPRTILSIDEQGVWLKGKDLIPWENINYYYSKNLYSKGINHVYFYLQPYSSDREIKIDLTFSSINNVNTIRRYIQLFKGKKNVTDLGKG